MNNFQFPPKEEKPQVAYTEMKLKLLITDIEKKLDKNQQDYWIIRTLLGQNRQSYLAFNSDYALSPKSKSLLINYPEVLINKTVVLTIKKRNKDDKEKVISLELES